MNEMMRICWENKTWRENYLRSKNRLNPDEDRFLVTFLNEKQEKPPQEKQDPLSDENMINLLVEWLGNQRWPELGDEGGSEE